MIDLDRRSRSLRRARVRFFIALGLPGTLAACASPGRPVPPTAATNNVAPLAPADVPVAPVQGEAGAPLRCGPDQLRDMACVAAKGSCSPELSSWLSASFLRVDVADSSAKFTHDPVLTTDMVSKNAGRALCCYVRCSRLQVFATASLSSTGFKQRCVSMPDAPSSVPAATAPNCPAAAVVPGQSQPLPFDEIMASGDPPGRFPDTWSSGRCCYLDNKDWPTGVGRPLVVDGRRCLPADAPLPLAALSAPQRLVAQHWHSVARGEYASISAFTLLALDLQHHGAPPELLRAVSRAAADEAVHARLAYDHLSGLIGSRVAPGNLSPSWKPKTIVELALDTLADGCFEETLGALLAEHLTSVVESPDLRRTLQRIANDELRHAELAFRILAFCLEREPEILPRLEQALARIERSLPALMAAPSCELERHGLPGTETLQTLARSICEDIVAPCLGALSARSAA